VSLSSAAWWTSAALATCVGCGRIGYVELAEISGDSNVTGDAGPDRSGDGTAPVDSSSGDHVSSDGGIDDSALDTLSTADSPAGVDASDAPPDSALDGPPDVTPDSALDAPPDAPACTVNVSASVDYCTTLPFLPQAPVIDGKVDCSLPLVDIVPIGWSGGASPPDATAQYAVAWRPEGIYLFVQVHDPSLVPADPSESTWQGDAVELYADSDGVFAAPPAYDNPGTRQFSVAAPPNAQSSVARAQIWYTGSVTGATWTSTQFGAYGLPDGYAVEALVTGPDLGLPPLTLGAGGQVGMDISIDVSYPTDQGPDAGGAGNRLGQYYLRVAAPDAGGGIPPFDVRAFCVPALAGM
jgi:hypothetical protein